MKHKIELVLRVDGNDVETMSLDGRMALLDVERRADGIVVALFHDDYDGWPPPSLLQSTGYPGAHTLAWRMVDVGKERVWRMVKAVGWKQEGS